MAKRRTRLPPYLIVSFEDLWLQWQQLGSRGSKADLMAHIANWHLAVDYFAVSRKALQLLTQYPALEDWVTLQVQRTDVETLETARRAGAIPLPTDYRGPGNGGNFYFRIPNAINPLPEHVVGGV